MRVAVPDHRTQSRYRAQMTALDNVLPGEPGPITVPLDRFRPGIPADTWPIGLPDVGVLRRSDVFAVADAWRDRRSTARQLTLAVLLWGFGDTSYGPHRTRKIFAADPEGIRLEAALAPLCADRLDIDDLRAVYVSMRRASRSTSGDLGQRSSPSSSTSPATAAASAVCSRSSSTSGSRPGSPPTPGPLDGARKGGRHRSGSRTCGGPPRRRNEQRSAVNRSAWRWPCSTTSGRRTDRDVGGRSPDPNAFRRCCYPAHTVC